jgi:hypothetical protein
MYGSRRITTRQAVLHFYNRQLAGKQVARMLHLQPLSRSILSGSVVASIDYTTLGQQHSLLLSTQVAVAAMKHLKGQHLCLHSSQMFCNISSNTLWRPSTVWVQHLLCQSHRRWSIAQPAAPA